MIESSIFKKDILHKCDKISENFLSIWNKMLNSFFLKTFFEECITSNSNNVLFIYNEELFKIEGIFYTDLKHKYCDFEISSKRLLE